MGQCFSGVMGMKAIVSRRLSLSTEPSGVSFFRQQQLIERFTHEEVEILRGRFDAVSAAVSKGPRLRREDFSRILPEKFFACFDLDRAGSISFRDFCVGLAVGAYGEEVDFWLFLQPITRGREDMCEEAMKITDCKLLAPFPDIEEERNLAELVRDFHSRYCHGDRSVVCGLSSPCVSPRSRVGHSQEAVAVFPQRWLQTWLTFVANYPKASRPGLIEADSLIAEETDHSNQRTYPLLHLKTGLLEDYDFGLVPLSVASALLRVYGLAGRSYGADMGWGIPVRRLGELQPATVRVCIVRHSEIVHVVGFASQTDSLVTLALTLANKHLSEPAFILESVSGEPLVSREDKGGGFRLFFKGDLSMRQLVEGNSNTVTVVLRAVGKNDDIIFSDPPVSEYVASRSLWCPMQKTGHHRSELHGSLSSPFCSSVDWIDIDDLDLNESPNVLASSYFSRPCWAQPWLSDNGLALDFWLSVSGGFSVGVDESFEVADQSLISESLEEVDPSLDGGPIKADRKWFPAGFRNLGNTCFMNSVLQCLMHTEYLKTFFLSSYFQRSLSRNESTNRVAAELLELMRQIHVNSERPRVVDMRNFKRRSDEELVEFSDRMQHDAHEYFSALLDLLHEDLLRVGDGLCRSMSEEVSLQSVVQELFEGELEVRLSCETCGSEKTSSDLVRTLPISLVPENNKISRVFHITKSGTPRRFKLSGVHSVHDLFRRCASIGGLVQLGLVENVDKSGRAGRIILASETDEVIGEMKDETELVLCELEDKRGGDGEGFIWPRFRGGSVIGKVMVVVQQRRVGKVVFGVPFILNTSEDRDCRSLYRSIEDQCRSFFGTSDFKKIVLTDSRGRHCGRSRCDRRTIECTGCELPKFKRFIGELSALQAGKIYVAVEWEMKHIDKIFVPLFSAPKDEGGVCGVEMQECIKRALGSEIVEGVECDTCGIRGNFIKQLEFQKFPEILVVVVKRFYFSGCAWKLQDALHFHENLEIKSGNLKTVQNYELYGVLNHEGPLTGSGHYTAVIKIEGRWLRFDDSKVSEIEKDICEISSKTCYLLFYRRKIPRVSTLLTYICR